MNKALLAIGFLAFVGATWLLVGAPGKDRLLSSDSGTDEHGLSGLEVKLSEERSGRTVTDNENTLMKTDQQPQAVSAPTELVVETLEEGTGDRVSANGDQLSVHYVGTLLSGTKFDSSRDRGTPFTFTLGAGQVIAGWDQGMLGMKIGEMRKLTIPASLGYGSRGAGDIIPPNATLVFEVELLSID